MPGIIDFIYNGNNKLNCHAFTTIRLRNDNKYKIGAEFYINLKQENRNVSKGTAHVVAINYFKINQLNNFVAYIDSGCNMADCKRMIENYYKNVQPPINWETQELCLILLVKNK